MKASFSQEMGHTMNRNYEVVKKQPYCGIELLN